MCFVVGGETPKFVHSSYKLAVNEAKRLLKLTGKQVLVLERKAILTPFAKVEEF